MRIEIEARDLLTIADEILHNCAALDNCDEDDIDDLIPYHVNEIRQLTVDLAAVVKLKAKQTVPGGAK